MAKYKIWDKQEDIYTIGRDKDTGKVHWTAREYIDYNAPWADNPNVKVIVGGGAINGTMFMEYEATKEFYVRQGVDFSVCTTDEEVLEAMEAWDNRVIEPTVTAEERSAAALEAIAEGATSETTAAMDALLTGEEV